MHARLGLAVGIAALLLSCGGCQQATRAVTSFGEWMGDTTNSLAHKSRRDARINVTLEGPVALDVESFNGDVLVECDPALPGGRISIERMATHGYGRGGEAKASLDEIDYSVQLVPGDIGQTLQIRVWTTHAEPHFQRLNLRISMPEVDGLRIRTSNGNIIARNVEGEVDIVTSHGGVRLMTNLPMYQPVTIINNAGSIDYRVRGESTGEFDCHTVRGKVMHLVRYGEMIVHNGTTHDRLLATLNSGNNPVVLRAAGNIRVAVVAEPTKVGVVIRD